MSNATTEMGETTTSEPAGAPEQEHDEHDEHEEGERFTVSLVCAVESPMRGQRVNDGAESLFDVKASLRLPRISPGAAAELLPIVQQFLPQLLPIIGQRFGVQCSYVDGDAGEHAPGCGRGRFVVGEIVHIVSGEHIGKKGRIVAADPKVARWIVDVEGESFATPAGPWFVLDELVPWLDLHHRDSARAAG